MSELAAMPKDARAAPEAPTAMSKALTFIVNTVINCQQRGGYTLEEAMSIHAATSYFTSHGRDSSQDADLGTKHLTFIVRMLEKSQSLGKLTLEEAWTVYNAIRLFAHSSPAPPSETPISLEQPAAPAAPSSSISSD